MRPAVRIDVGARWVTEAGWLLGAEVGGPPRAVDLDVLRAPIDLVVRSRNLTEALPDEPVVPLLYALAGAVEALSVGRLAKALVGFREAPWELALVRQGADVRLALYELTAPARVVVDGLVVPLRAVRQAVVRALDDALDALRDAVPSRPADELLGVLREARSMARAPVLAPRATVPDPASTPLVVETRAPRFALRTRLDDLRGDLLAYDGEHPHDRHALLTPGVIELLVDQGTALRLSGRPLALLDATSSSLAGLVGAAWPVTGELARTPGARWLLELDPPRATLTHVDAEGARHGVDFDAGDLVAALCDHTVDVLGACLRANPLLECNELVTDAMDAAEVLRVRSRRTLEPHGDPLAAVPGAARAHLAPRTTPRPPPWRAAEDVRRMRYERSWTLRRSGMRREPLWLGPGRRLLVSDAGLEAISVADGAVQWHVDGGPRRRRSASVSHDLVVSVDGRGDLVALSAATGETARVWSPGRPVGRVDEVVWCTSTVGVECVVTTGDGRVLALGHEGRPRWAASVGTASRRAVAVCGGHVIVVSRNGGLIALHPEAGERAWTERVEASDVQIVAGPRYLLVLGASPLEARGFVGVLDGVTGRWQLRIEDAFDVHDVQVSGGTAVVLLGDPVTETRNLCAFSLDDGVAGARVAFTAAGAASARARLALCRGHMVVAEPQRVSARSLDAPGDAIWSVDPGAWGRPSPRIATTGARAPLVAWATDGEVVVADARTGVQLARVDAFWEQLDGLVFTDDAGLLVVERCGPRERALHRLGLAGLLSVVK